MRIGALLGALCLVTGCAVSPQHIHVRLSVYDRQGVPVVVPAGIGDAGGAWLSLHTHDSSGVIHQEPLPGDAGPFTLGRFFVEWGRSLDGATVVVDGKPIGEGRYWVLRDGARVEVYLP